MAPDAVVSSSTGTAQAQSATVTSSSDSIAERIVVSSESERDVDDVEAEDDGTGENLDVSLSTDRAPIATTNGVCKGNPLDASRGAARCDLLSGLL